MPAPALMSPSEAVPLSTPEMVMSGLPAGGTARDHRRGPSLPPKDRLPPPTESLMVAGLPLLSEVPLTLLASVRVPAFRSTVPPVIIRAVGCDMPMVWVLPFRSNSPSLLIVTVAVGGNC